MKDVLDFITQLRENYYLDSLREAEDDAGPEEKINPEMKKAALQSPSEEAIPAQEIPPMPDQTTGQDTMMGQDPTLAGQDTGIDPMTGMPTEKPKTPGELGRIYELNKIYSRLYTVHNLVRSTSDPNIISLKQTVAEAFDLFRLVLNNLKSFKDKIDDVILSYYKFLGSLVIILSKYYKNKDRSQEGFE